MEKRTRGMCSECSRTDVTMSRGICTMCRHRTSPPAQCSVCGERRKIAVKSRMLCGACQSRERRGRLGYDAAYKTLSKQCGYCSESFATKNHVTKFCSVRCGQLDAYGYSKSRELVRVRPPRVWFGVTVPGTRFMSGPCSECGSQFVARGTARYCSDRCSKRASWRRRYERRGKFVVSDRVRLAVYERDAWTCQLCFGQVDPALPYTDSWSATLDHVVPQSHQLLPDHSPSNLRLAHRICNSLRGDGSREVDYGTSIEAVWDVRGLSQASA